MYKLARKIGLRMRPAGSWMRMCTALLPVILLTSTTVAAFFYLHAREKEYVTQEFGIIVRQYPDLFDRRIQVTLTILNTTAGFFAGSVEVSRAEFHEFVASASIQNHGIQAIEWVPRVLEDERATYEAAARTDGLNNFAIYEEDPAGNFIPASKREEYFPAFYLEPLSGNEALLGLDLNLNPVRHEALERARDSGKLVTTAPIRLAPELDTQARLLIFQPMYAKGKPASTVTERRLHIAGFTVSVFRADTLVDKALMSIAQQDVAIRLVDTGAAQGQNLLYESASFMAASKNPEAEATRWITTLNVPGRVWQLDIVPTPEFFAAHQSPIAWIVFASGLLVAALVQMLISAISGRSAHIEHLVTERTEDLERANITLIKEVDERKHAQEALRVSEEQLRLFIEHAPAAIAMFDQNMHYLAASRRWLIDYNLGEQDLVGRSHYEVFPEIPERWREAHRRCLGGAVEKCEEDHFDRADGTVQWLHWEIHPWWRGDSDEVGGILMFTVDITERRRAEEERLQLQRQLQQAQKMEAIGQLTGGIAHDFNNILTSILGFSDLAITHFATDQKSKPYQYLREIQIAGERARDLVAKMLTFSRGAKMEVKSLQIALMVKEVVQTLRSVLPASIELTCRIGENVPAVMMDEVQLHQILMNLCINARDAMQGQGSIEISLHHRRKLRFVCDSCHRDLKGDFVELVVKDDGQGIPEDVLPHIFEPFFTTKEIGKGTGMGLSMVQGIVHEPGGHIRVTAVQEQGSTFRLLLPVATQEIITSPVVPQTAPRLNAAGGRILIVDDESTLTRYFTELLEGHGYTIKSFNDPVETLVYFQANSDAVDLVLTDQTMPGMTGAEMVQEIFKLRRDLPVILTTGYSDQIDEQKAKQLNIRAFLAKPVKADQLLALIGELLGTKM